MVRVLNVIILTGKLQFRKSREGDETVRKKIASYSCGRHHKEICKFRNAVAFFFHVRGRRTDESRARSEGFYYY